MINIVHPLRLWDIGVPAGCPHIPHHNTPGVCDACGTTLTGRKKRWCSDTCQYAYRAQHDWGAARHKAKQRDNNTCTNCGAVGHYDWRNPDATVRLEVNHIEPRVGKGYGFGCHNHQTNLETLCHPCHVEVTKQQAANRRAESTTPADTSGKVDEEAPALLDTAGGMTHPELRNGE
jgi:5-methylcytosine-specific restriction endonuclease McrA